MSPETGYYNSRLMWFPTRDALEQEGAAWRGRLRDPRAKELEAYFGNSAPEDLLWLYKSHDLAGTDGFLLAEILGVRNKICVWPADMQTVQECWAKLPPGHFPFAELVGSFYSVRFTGKPGYVYFTELGTSETVEVGDSLRGLVVGVSS